MYSFKRLSQVFKSAQNIPFDDSSKIILISDCHRGDGSGADDFSKNQLPYFAALTYYNNKNYTYIELGDGDELWKNKKMSEISQVHSDVFWLLSKFYTDDRLYFIYGNHDIIKKNKKYVKSEFNGYFDEHEKKYIHSFKDIKFHEGLVLRHSVTRDKILLLHGHQADYFNDKLWRLSRFLVRYLWRPLELIGINDPTSTSKNNAKKACIKKNLIEWVKKEKQMLIAGHTHRTMFPKTDEPPYFNDGSCVHPRCITGIEIVDGYISLIKWHVKTKPDGSLFVDKDLIEGPIRLKDYFNKELVSKKEYSVVK
jgi:UDP-2,3-diacylglucosamine pyrophosphatase LpxH